jgi:hypothetical protein
LCEALNNLSVQLNQHPRPCPIKRQRHFPRLLLDHRRFDLAYAMHLAGFAVEAQSELLLALGDGHGLGAHGALHAGDAFGLLGAEAQGEAHAVLGDHQLMQT